MGSGNFIKTLETTHFYRHTGDGTKFIMEHGSILVGVCDANGVEYFYGDRIEISANDAGDSPKLVGKGIILRVWDKGGCLFEVLMDNGERGFIRPKFLHKVAA